MVRWMCNVRLDKSHSRIFTQSKIAMLRSLRNKVRYGENLRRLVINKNVD